MNMGDAMSIKRSGLEKHRKTLSVYWFRKELIKAVEDYQVLIIFAEPGTGKSTQIPQYLHEAGYTRRGKIACTQSQRIAATSVATRVSQEMGVQLGQEVGYSIPSDDHTSQKTVLKYMIDGMLLRELLNEPIWRVADYLNATIDLALEIHAKEPPGDVLVFLTCQEEIKAAEKILKHSRIRGIFICPVYSNLPTERVARIFQPAPIGARKIVLATDVAETLLSIVGIGYVVDPGYCQKKFYNPMIGTVSLRVNPISKASAHARAAAAAVSGPTTPGKCFLLYTDNCYETEFHDKSPSEIKRTNLARVVLYLKSLGIRDLFNFDFMDPPSIQTLLETLDLLRTLGAINELGELTKDGRLMAEFGIDHPIRKAISSRKFQNI
ncbi:hypothetical protein V6N11_032346 [Hibiscus sabdariffa]|uniref:RNA helicase n=1 Tax=Hibiscus sabdariffa TaxID=183260 RepID=A0ABR2T0D3_9ROSI